MINNNNNNNNNNKDLDKNKSLEIMNKIFSSSNGVMSIIAFSKFLFPKSGENVDLYATTLFTFETPSSSAEEIEARLEILKFKNLIMFDIEPDGVGIGNYQKWRQFRSYIGRNVHMCKIIPVTNSELFSETFLGALSEASEKCKDLKIVFILRGIKWSLLKIGLKKYNINLNSGNNTLKRVLSPQQFVLSKVAMILYGFNTKIVTDSFAILSRNPALSKSLFNFTDEDTEIFIDSFPYGKRIFEEVCNKKFSSKDELQKSFCANINKSVCSSNIKEISTKKGGVSQPQEVDSKNINPYLNIKKVNNRAPLSFQRTTKSIIKRGIHTTAPFKNSDIKKSDYSAYLTELGKIINDSSIRDEEKQLIFENFLNYYIKQLVEDDQIFIQKYKGALQKFEKGSVKEVIYEALKTYKLHKNKGNIGAILPTSDEAALKFIIVSYSIILSYYSKLGYTAIAALIGKTFMEMLYLEERSSLISYSEGESSMISLNDYYNYKKIDDVMLIKIGDYYISLLSQFPHNVFERDFVNSTKSNKEVVKIKINPEFLNSIRDNLIIPPVNLPMLSKPAKWSQTAYGGYLKNSVIKQDIVTKSTDNKHKTKNKTQLYKAVNILNSTKFGVNTMLLDYLFNEGKFILDNVKASDDLQRSITLKLAYTLSKAPFYLTVRSDWRGRLVTESFFLTYQGNDLSLALINFWEGEALTDEGLYYFYVYGANNHNFNGISKKSYIERVNWVKSNYDKIVKLDRELILSAENPFTFASFCLNMKQIERDRNWIVKSPVLLDATCSGIQHLAGLLRDLELGANVNLVKSSHSDAPSDIYTSLLDPINKAINKFGEENIAYSHLSLIKFDRKTIKQSIMTKVYNVTTYGISEQLKNKMESVDHEHVSKLAEEIKSNIPKKGRKYYLAPGKDTPVLVTELDIFKIATIINDEIFVVYPSLNDIYNFFIEIAKVVVKLGVPLAWVTPNGMEILQHYLVTKENKTAINLFGKSKTLVLKQVTNEINKSKQINAIIPNIIHSLDAAHLIKVVVSSIKGGYYPMLTIHDCFGTHPNKMEILSHKVKTEFTLLYTKEDFMKKFLKNIISNLKANNFKVKGNKGIYYVYFEVNNEWIKLPELPKLGELDLNAIKESSYMLT